jgi:SOS-response transcriptional repressor LexA
MYGLSNPQNKVLQYIIRYQLQYGHSPSVGDIATGLGQKSKANVHRILKELVTRKRIRMMPRKARTIEVIYGRDS